MCKFSKCQEFKNLQAGYGRLKKESSKLLVTVGEQLHHIMELEQLVDVKDRQIDLLRKEKDTVSIALLDTQTNLKGERLLSKGFKTQLDKANRDLKSAKGEVSVLKKRLADVRFCGDDQELYEAYCDMRRENEALKELLNDAKSEISRLENKRNSGSNDFWDSVEFVGHMEKNEREDIVFRQCKKHGDTFLDARVVRDGEFTRKGICMKLDKFMEFARKCIVVLSRIESNVYNKEEIKRAKNSCKA